MVHRTTIGHEFFEEGRLASLIGTTIEWYDFFIYSTAAVLVFNHLFFPASTPRSAPCSRSLPSRPASLPDRSGRWCSVISVTGRVEVDDGRHHPDHGHRHRVIGLLPTYETIGVFAPVLLVVLRLTQGFALGGEWGGAVLMATEHSPQGRRGFFGSWPQAGVAVGLILAMTVYLPLDRMSDRTSWPGDGVSRSCSVPCS